MAASLGKNEIAVRTKTGFTPWLFQKALGSEAQAANVPSDKQYTGAASTADEVPHQPSVLTQAELTLASGPSRGDSVAWRPDGNRLAACGQRGLEP